MGNRSEAMGMCSLDGEYVEFSHPVLLEGPVEVSVWEPCFTPELAAAPGVQSSCSTPELAASLHQRKPPLVTRPHCVLPCHAASTPHSMSWPAIQPPLGWGIQP